MNSKPTSPQAKIKSFLNGLLSPLGVQLIRCSPRDRRETVTQIIGNYPIEIQAANNLWREYAKNPNYTGQLARIARLVFQAYPDTMAIDVGANIGDTAALIRSTSAAPILCIEGDAKIIPQLQKNIDQLGRTTIKSRFLGEHTEKLSVLTDKDGWDATLVPTESSEGTKIDLVSLDDLLAEDQARPVCKLLKVDVEGFDLRVLRGAPQLLAKEQPVVLFELNHQNLEKIGEKPFSIFPYLAGFGYSQLVVYDGQGSFMLDCNIEDVKLLEDLYKHAQGLDFLHYFDICAFSKNDAALAEKIIKFEREFRDGLLKQAGNLPAPE